MQTTLVRSRSGLLLSGWVTSHTGRCCPPNRKGKCRLLARTRLLKAATTQADSCWHCSNTSSFPEDLKASHLSWLEVAVSPMMWDSGAPSLSRFWFVSPLEHMNTCSSPWTLESNRFDFESWRYMQGWEGAATLSPLHSTPKIGRSEKRGPDDK